MYFSGKSENSFSYAHIDDFNRKFTTKLMENHKLQLWQSFQFPIQFYFKLETLSIAKSEKIIRNPRHNNPIFISLNNEAPQVVGFSDVISRAS